MIIVLFVIGIALIIWGVITCDHSGEDSAIAPAVIGTILSCGSLIGFLFTLGCIVDASYIPEKIKMLEEENTRMEATILDVVEQYCEYENKTYQELKPDQIDLVFVLYPELKADTMFTSYVEVLTENRNYIKQLKLDEISAKSARWWLYFG